MTVSYKIEITPLKSDNVYGSAVDVSSFVTKGGVGRIKKQLDNGQYEVGVYNYGSIVLTLNNQDGEFNESRFDIRSIFPYQRDRAKVDITFIDQDSNQDISYRGIITDKATRQDSNKQSVKFKVLSLDSVFQQEELVDGSIQDGDTFTQAFQVILGSSFISSVLNVDISNINPTIDLEIDDGSFFNGLLAKNSLDGLLHASNSILLIDDDNNVIIRSRVENSNTPHIFYLRDQYKRDNVKNITNFNNGLQRMFNSVFVNGVSAKNDLSVSVYKTRKLSFSLPLITNPAKSLLIAQSILGTFGTPKVEMDVTTGRDGSEDFEFLDKSYIFINPYLSKPVYSDPALFDADRYNKSRYAVEKIDLRFPSNRLLKIIASFENPETFDTTFRLREI